MKKALRKFAKVIFILSFVYYIYWLIYSIYIYFAGIETGWFISSLSSGKVVYGLEALEEGLEKFLIVTALFFFWIPLYQLIYLICCAVSKRKKKKDS